MLGWWLGWSGWSPSGSWSRSFKKCPESKLDHEGWNILKYSLYRPARNYILDTEFQRQRKRKLYIAQNQKSPSNDRNVFSPFFTQNIFRWRVVFQMHIEQVEIFGIVWEILDLLRYLECFEKMGIFWEFCNILISLTSGWWGRRVSSGSWEQLWSQNFLSKKGFAPQNIFLWSHYRIHISSNETTPKIIANSRRN